MTDNAHIHAVYEYQRHWPLWGWKAAAGKNASPVAIDKQRNWAPVLDEGTDADGWSYAFDNNGFVEGGKRRIPLKTDYCRRRCWRPLKGNEPLSASIRRTSHGRSSQSLANAFCTAGSAMAAEALTNAASRASRHAANMTASAATAVGWEHVIDLTYIGADNRLIAMGFPGGPDSSTPLEVAARRLRTAHDEHFMIWNFSGAQYDYAPFDHRVIDCPCPGHPSPPLSLLCNACAAIDRWLAADSRNVAVVHCRTGLGRTNTLLACYLAWSCEFPSAVQALHWVVDTRHL